MSEEYRQDCDYGKGNISVVISDIDILKRLTLYRQ